jgi:hypothetical protein
VWRKNGAVRPPLAGVTRDNFSDFFDATRRGLGFFAPECLCSPWNASLRTFSMPPSIILLKHTSTAGSTLIRKINEKEKKSRLSILYKRFWTI